MKDYCKHQFVNSYGRWDRYCYRLKGHEGKHMHKSGEWFDNLAKKEKPKYLSWMYTLFNPSHKPPYSIYECPLCFALVGGTKIKLHTDYHESRGEEDSGPK